MTDTAKEQRRRRNQAYRDKLAQEGVIYRQIRVHQQSLPDLEALAAATLDGETTVADAAQVLLPLNVPDDEADKVHFTPHTMLHAILAEGSPVPKAAVDEIVRLNGQLELALAQRNKFLARYEMARQKQLAGTVLFRLKGKARRDLFSVLGLHSSMTNAQAAQAIAAAFAAEAADQEGGA